MPSISKHGQESRFSSALGKPGNLHGKRSSPTALTCQWALQGCDGTFGSVPPPLRLGPRDPRGQRPREQTASPGKRQHIAAARFSLASYCRLPREGFAAPGKEMRGAPFTTCFQSGPELSPHLSQGLAGTSRTQPPRITPKGDIHTIVTVLTLFGY